MTIGVSLRMHQRFLPMAIDDTIDSADVLRQHRNTVDSTNYARRTIDSTDNNRCDVGSTNDD